MILALITTLATASNGAYRHRHHHRLSHVAQDVGPAAAQTTPLPYPWLYLRKTIFDDVDSFGVQRSL